MTEQPPPDLPELPNLLGHSAQGLGDLGGQGDLGELPHDDGYLEGALVDDYGWLAISCRVISTMSLVLIAITLIARL